MAIKSRFLTITALIILLIGAFSWLSMRVLAEDIIISWVERYAEKQIKYDKVRMLMPLIQEVNLSKEFAEIASLKAWAKQPDNADLQQKAWQDAEDFRLRFAENAYFMALKNNNHYYYSDDKVTSNYEFYRYTLDASKPTDAWFYQIMAEQIDLHLNVNPDVELGVIKLWSDVLIRDGDDILGVVGTGLDLSLFLQQMIDQQDIYSAIVFTNYEGSIQLHQQEELIDYAALTMQAHNKRLIFQLLDDESSKVLLQESFQRAKANPNQVEMVSVNKQQTRQLASVIYIPEIDWYQVNFIDINNFLPINEFFSLLMVFLIGLVGALIIMYCLLSLMVTRPLAELDVSIRALGENDYRAPQLSCFAGKEIKRLSRHYQKMSTALLEYQFELETKVAQRTEALNRLAKIDPLTELYNRRGFEIYMTHYMQNWQQHGERFGVINLDVNKFKEVNDEFGHAAGDQVLQRIAKYLQSTVGKRGQVARWGGDEFLILLGPDHLDYMTVLITILEDKKPAFILDAAHQEVRVQFSVGSASIQENDTLESLLQRADKAMYAMKFAGR